MPVIQARPVISGIDRGAPADRRLPAPGAPVKRVPMIDSCTNGRPASSSPRACRWAIRALVPVPHGERSTQPGMDRGGGAAVGAVGLGSSVQITWWQPRMASFSGWTGSGTAAMSCQARLDQRRRVLGRRRRSPGRRRVGDGVEVAAEGHVVADAVDLAVELVHERRGRCGW